MFSRKSPLFIFLLSWVVCSISAGDIQRYLYLSIPDGAQKRDPVEPGIYVFDIDDEHKFVKFIPMPSFSRGLRGFCPSLANHSAYYTDTKGLIGCFDLEADKIVWERYHDYGWDRACITDDGSKIYAPFGWWHRAADGGFAIINPENGDILDNVITGGSPHNSLITQDGKYMLVGGWSWLNMYDVETDEVIWRFTAIGDDGVFPFVVNSDSTLGYVCHRRHVGFDVVDLVKGNKLHTIGYGDEPPARRTHGVGLTPDESEVWISDQHENQLIVYDNTVMPPVFKQEIPLSRGGHGWITFSIDRRFAWCHTPDVIDPKTKEVVATLMTEDGTPIASSKFFEAHFKDGKLIRVGNQFGLGMKTRGPLKLKDLN
ncbi:MAG: hypothetical protein MI748_08865 [Opitutales bacterium]|nr:hypothetical protein [Opitutales bacterium]